MKLQIEGQRLRLRVGEDELQRLRDGAALASTTWVPAGRFEWLVQLAPESAVVIEGDRWTFLLPAAAIDEFASRLPSRDGLSFAFPQERQPALELLFDVDVRDSVRTRGPSKRRH